MYMFKMQKCVSMAAVDDISEYFDRSEELGEMTDWDEGERD